MPKDYQEVERIVEELETRMTALNNQYHVSERDWKIQLNTTISMLRQALTTYGNTRVEEIIKIIETLEIKGCNQFSGDKREDVADYLNDWLMPEIKRNLIQAIKKPTDDGSPHPFSNPEGVYGAIKK